MEVPLPTKFVHFTYSCNSNHNGSDPVCRLLVSVLSAVTPPGHFTDATGTYLCANGTYRQDWLPYGQATSCFSCGELLEWGASEGWQREPGCQPSASVLWGLLRQHCQIT